MSQSDWIWVACEPSGTFEQSIVASSPPNYSGGTDYGANTLRFHADLASASANQFYGYRYNGSESGRHHIALCDFAVRKEGLMGQHVFPGFLITYEALSGSVARADVKGIWAGLGYSGSDNRWMMDIIDNCYPSSTSIAWTERWAYNSTDNGWFQGQFLFSAHPNAYGKVGGIQVLFRYNDAAGGPITEPGSAGWEVWRRFGYIDFSLSNFSSFYDSVANLLNSGFYVYFGAIRYGSYSNTGSHYIQFDRVRIQFPSFS